MIYKSGQGVIARVTAAVLLGALTLYGFWRFYQIYNGVSLVHTIAFAGGDLILGVGLIWYFTNTPRMAEHLIEAEIELKKVVWPSQPEIVRATGIVLAVMVIMGAILFVADLGLQELLFLAF